VQEYLMLNLCPTRHARAFGLVMTILGANMEDGLVFRVR